MSSPAWRIAHREEIAAKKTAYDAAHREEIAAYSAAYAKAHRKEKAAYAAAHREHIAAYQAIYGVTHREEIAATKAAHHEENATTKAAYKVANPEMVAAHNALRRARKLGNSIGFPLPDYKAILAEFGMVCHICGLEIKSRADLHMEHVIALANEGLHSSENIRPSHALCNLRKGTKSLAKAVAA
jgi:hypothetical protein